MGAMDNNEEKLSMGHMAQAGAVVDDAIGSIMEGVGRAGQEISGALSRGRDLLDAGKRRLVGSSPDAHTENEDTALVEFAREVLDRLVPARDGFEDVFCRISAARGRFWGMMDFDEGAEHDDEDVEPINDDRYDVDVVDFDEGAVIVDEMFDDDYEEPEPVINDDINRDAGIGARK